MNNKNETKVLLTIFGWLLIIPVVYMNLKDIVIRADRPILMNVVVNLMGLLIGILFNPITIIGICLLIIANRKSRVTPKNNKSKNE